VKLLKLLANLGYGSRREVANFIRDGWITDVTGAMLDGELDILMPAANNVAPARASKLKAQLAYESVRVDGQPLDVPPGTVLLLNKPVGYTCSSRDVGKLIYDLLPTRFHVRDPIMASIGRLDRETSGLLLLTDDGALQHRITSPKTHLPKVYRATLAQELRGDEASIFASATLMLDGESTPLRAAHLEALTPTEVRLIISEGRYHQVRRMFAAVGNHVTSLHRERIGTLDLGDLASGEWRVLAQSELNRVFEI
jgi:16S rRNA pseudouridine516 synthase